MLLSLCKEKENNLKKQVGLIEYLQDQIDELPIINYDNYDYLPFGKDFRFSDELLESKIFSNAIDFLKQQYDIILLANESDIDLSKAKIYINNADKIIISLRDEKLDQLSYFTTLFKYDKNRVSVVLV